jgi:hypothetical protein
MSKRAVFAALCACCALVGVGCGSDDKKSDSGGGGASSTTAPSISKSEFIAKADAICKKGDDAINAAGAKVFPRGKEPSKEQVQQFATDSVVPALQGEVDQIRALGAPAGDEDTIDAMLKSVQEGVDQIKGDPSILTQQETPQPFKDANAKAKAYGLKVCGED